MLKHCQLCLIVAAIVLMRCHPLMAENGFSLQPAGNHVKVISVHEPQATTAFEANASRVQGMVDTGIIGLTGKASSAEAWRSLASTNEIIGIKVYSSPGASAGTRPEVVAAVVNGLLHAGFATNHIIVWDRYLAHLRRAGYLELETRFGIRVAGAVDTGFDQNTFYDTASIGNLVYGDLEFGSKEDGAGRKSYVSTLVTRSITKIINIAPVLNHNGAGVTGNLFSLALGSIDNVIRFESSPEHLASAVPELYALPALGDRVILNISDALLCQYQGEERSLLHYTVALNEIRFSRDPVALDVLALEDLVRNRRSHANVEFPVNREIYKNAALLQLGVADLNHIDLTKLKLPAQGPTDTR
jgi:hypothetical protein